MYADITFWKANAEGTGGSYVTEFCILLAESFQELKKAEPATFIEIVVDDGDFLMIPVELITAVKVRRENLS